MRRREFVTILGGTAAAWPRAVMAQQAGKLPVVGYLNPISPVGIGQTALTSFRQGLREIGFVEGQNVIIEYRWAEGQLDRLPAVAADLVRRQVAVIATTNGPAPAQAAMAATSTIPIVFVTASDPVQIGMVASLNRPGGNVTGVTQIGTEITGKRLELLLELVPHAKTVGQIVSAGFPELTNFSAQEVAVAARALRRESFVVEVRSIQDFEATFETLARRKADALFVTAAPLFGSNRRRITELAERFRIPAAFHDSDFVREGGLMSYGPNIANSYRLGGTYVGQILKGTKPADLPVQRPTRFELVINMKTAKALSRVSDHARSDRRSQLRACRFCLPSSEQRRHPGC